jgi:hypothetical protein
MSSIAGSVNVLDDLDPLFRRFCREKKNESIVGKGNLKKLADEWDEYITRILKGGLTSDNPETISLRTVYKIAKKHNAKPLMVDLEGLIERKIREYRDALEREKDKLQVKTVLEGEK